MPDNTFIHPSSIIEDGAQIGAGTRIWHFCHLMPGAVLGEDCIVGQNVFIDNNTQIGNGVKIQNNVSIYTGVVLEDEVFVGPSVVFTNVIDPRSFIERKHEFRKTVIRKGASLGANATILCGIEIGSYAMVGAGAVVTKNVPAYAVVRGNPARHEGWVSKAGRKLVFDAQNMAICPENGETYKINNERISPVE
jgi:UDP-2-acetamido-3-amino-2,3-dideoxy-glucuronate N-acetyltransferase